MFQSLFQHMEVSWNGGAPKSSMFKRYSIIINHTVFLGYLHLWKHPYHIFPSWIGYPDVPGPDPTLPKRSADTSKVPIKSCAETLWFAAACYKMSWINNRRCSADQKCRYIYIYIYMCVYSLMAPNVLTGGPPPPRYSFLDGRDSCVACRVRKQR